MVFPLKPRLTITNRQEARSYFIPFTTIKPLLNHFFGMTWLYNSHWTHCQIVMDPIHSVIIPWRWAMLSRHIVQASARCFSFEDGRENGKFTGRGNGATNNPWAGKSLLIYPTRLLFHSYVSVYQRVSMFMCVYLMFTYAFWISAKKNWSIYYVSDIILVHVLLSSYTTFRGKKHSRVNYWIGIPKVCWTSPMDVIAKVQDRVLMLLMLSY